MNQAFLNEISNGSSDVFRGEKQQNIAAHKTVAIPQGN